MMLLVRCLGLGCAVALAGCGGSTEGATTREHPSTSFQDLKLQAWPGFGPFCPQSPQVAELVTSSRRLSWSLCDFSAPSAAVVTGERTITQAEFDALGATLAQVTVSHAQSCGADAGIVALDVATARGAELYVDDFYSGCPSQIHEGRTFVTGLNELWAAVMSLATN